LGLIALGFMKVKLGGLVPLDNTQKWKKSGKDRLKIEGSKYMVFNPG